MSRRFLAAISALSILLVLTCTVLLNPSVSASPQELTVVSRTKGNEVLTAEAGDDQVRIKLKNNHKDTITAFVITISDTTIREDFAYSDVHFGIEPGDTFEKSYPFSPSPVGQLPTVHLLTVLLKDRTSDGDSKVAQTITDERLGEKIQLHRIVKILEREGSGKDIKALKGNVTAALDAGEYEVRMTRKELLPASRMDDSLSEDLRNGLHWAREKMLRKLQTLEELPTERQEQGVTELKARSQKLLSKL
jgi:hypothetical protein